MKSGRAEIQQNIKTCLYDHIRKLYYSVIQIYYMRQGLFFFFSFLISSGNIITGDLQYFKLGIES